MGNLKRGSGVLVHITSLPSKFGIGDFKEAISFVDLLQCFNQKYMQILPIGPTEPFFDNSPYHSVSAFAINPLFVSLEFLVRDGLLKPSDLDQFVLDESNVVDFVKVSENKFKALRMAFANFQETQEFEEFVQSNAFYLEDYALFVALKKRFSLAPFQEWPEEFKNRRSDALETAKEVLKEDIKFVKFVQFILSKQFLEFKEYANSKGVNIIGDLPIYVDLDSPDVWVNRELFELDESGYPINVAGVPPDYFNENGQLWGNPLYNWEKHKETGFSWWIKRIEHLLKYVNIIRIDHFRGFVAFYSIPNGSPNAKIGKWVNVPVYEFFDKILAHFNDMPFIAEDLGLITEDVVAVIKHYNIPNMRILTFAFDGNPLNPYLPHNYENPTVVYTGTHDHNTVIGWFKYELNDSQRNYLSKYIGHVPTLETINKDLIRLAHSSIAKLSIIPIQDVLGLDERFRMNTPGTSSGNWLFRLKRSDLREEAFEYLREVTQIFGR